MKPKILIPLVAVVIAATAIGYLFWNKSQKSAAIIASAVPEIPSNIESAELSKRIQNASTQAKEGPDQLDGLAELSRLYDANGYTRRAWECYAALVLVEPSEPRWPYLFGKILAGYGELEEAAPLFRRAVDLEPSYLPSHIRLADTLLKQNRFEEAKDAYEDALKTAPESAYALVGLARVAIANDDLPLAREHLEDAVRLTDYKIGADLLGDVYERLGLPALEKDVLQKMEWGSYADLPDPWSLTLMDDCYDAYQVSIAGGWVVHQGDIYTGLRYIKRAIDLAPDTAVLHFQIAGIYMNLNELDKAEEHFKRCVEIQPDFADAWLTLIEIAKRKQSPTLVRRTLDLALRAAPDSPSLNIEKGKMLLAQKRVADSIPYFERSIEIRPHEAIGYIELARAYLTNNEVEKGVGLIRTALDMEPNNPVALTTMAFDAIMRGDKTDADFWLTKIAKQPRITQQEIERLMALYRQNILNR